MMLVVVFLINRFHGVLEWLDVFDFIYFSAMACNIGLGRLDCFGPEFALLRGCLLCGFADGLLVLVGDLVPCLLGNAQTFRNDEVAILGIVFGYFVMAGF